MISQLTFKVLETNAWIINVPRSFLDGPHSAIPICTPIPAFVQQMVCWVLTNHQTSDIYKKGETKYIKLGKQVLQPNKKSEPNNEIS